MNPGVYSAVAAVCAQKKSVREYKNTYNENYGKQDTKIIWKTHITDLEKNAIKFLRRLNELEQYLKNGTYLYIELFKLIQEYGQGFDKKIINLVCIGDYDFGLYERRIYERFKEKFESKET